ncbi:LysR family transcriptional regulator [Cognatiyoonia sp. IB215446]|uniref:LysR family transcriptional regulator n=1 Tax=Cognatiyoonia sp. IB215446 TaxID=3097355 RepID=UPI002A1060FE|nr:LysR family transcriptional regulator [Cognatiyoonia sp. IB215446]MDX8346961.1 LysR family transcriptional regulator [Cognatiyoonia sp. IB215446]
MNWDAISFDWNQVRAFLATAEEGSFSAAARALKTTQPTVGRQISELEERLSVTLLERSQKGPKLTEAGEVLLHHVRAMSDAAMMVSMAAISQSVDVSGTVRITAFDMMAAQLLPAILLPLHEKAPGVRPQLISSNSIDDLLRREADIAVRHVRPSQPELIARHIGDLTTHLYASPAYLDRVGRPSSPRDAGDLTFVAPIEQDGVQSLLNSLGIPISDRNFAISSDAGTAISGCVKAGFGVSLLPAAICKSDPGYEQVLPDLRMPTMPVWLVTHRELQTSKRIRIVFDQIAYGLSQVVKAS